MTVLSDLPAETSSAASPLPLPRPNARACKMVHCKVSLAGSLRRFSVPDGQTDGTDAPALTLPALRRTIASLDPSLSATAALAYVDDEGDVCVLVNNRDLREALAITPALLRLRVDAAAAAPAAAPGACGRGPAGARGMKHVAGGRAGKNKHASGPAGTPRGLLPLFQRVEGKAVGSAFAAALASFTEAATGSAGDGSFDRKAGMGVCKMVRIFMSEQAAGRGDAAIVSAIPKDRLDELYGRVNQHLDGTTISPMCRERLIAVIHEAMADAGVRAGLIELVRSGPAKRTAADMAENQRPIQFIIQSASTPRSRVAINKARRAVRETDGARKLLSGVRPAIRKASMTFIREQCAKGPGVSLKSTSAPNEFGAEIRKIVADADADGALVDAAEEFAVAMANDPGARLAGVRLLKKFRLQRQENKANKVAAEGVVNDDGTAAADSAAAVGEDVDMAGAAIASVSIDEN